MYNVEQPNKLPVVTDQSILTRVVIQERENANLQADLELCKEAARQAGEEERAARKLAEESLLDVMRLCLSCAFDGVLACETTDTIVAQLSRHAEEEEAAANTFAAVAHHEQVALLARRGRVAVKGTAGTLPEDVERALAEAEEEAEIERAEILRLEREYAELQRRTELATIRYARELFNVHV